MTARAPAVAVGLALALGACAGLAAERTPPPVDPVGFYDFMATRGSDSRPGTLEIERIAGGLEAEAWLIGEPQPALSDSVLVDGSRVVLYTLVGGGDEVVFHLDFAAASFTGYLVAGLDTIGLQGQRRAP